MIENPMKLRLQTWSVETKTDVLICSQNSQKLTEGRRHHQSQCFALNINTSSETANSICLNKNIHLYNPAFIDCLHFSGVDHFGSGLERYLLFNKKSHIWMSKPIYQCSFNISSVKTLTGRAQKGRKLRRQWSRAQFGHQTQREWCKGGGTWVWDVRKERCPDSISSPPMGIPRMLQQCGNRLHPITPEALYPQSALLSKNWQLDCIELVQRLSGLLESEKLIILVFVFYKILDWTAIYTGWGMW